VSLLTLAVKEVHSLGFKMMFSRTHSSAVAVFFNFNFSYLVAVPTRDLIYTNKKWKIFIDVASLN